jgi:hypothetical protein
MLNEKVAFVWIESSTFCIDVDQRAATGSKDGKLGRG